jgi:enoyl-CoA hydratase/carnithine racemase
MELKDLLYEKKGAVALITMNRPEVLNAFRTNTFNELLYLLAETERDTEVRAVVITGNGRAFCAGDDLAELDTLLSQGVNLREVWSNLAVLQDITRRVVAHPRVVIAAVNGIAVGFGAELSLACDIRLASENAAIMFAEARRGLFQTNGVMYLLPRLIGQGHALEIMATARKVPASEAYGMGLFNRMVTGEKLLEEALSLAEAIAGNAPMSVGYVKKLLRRTYEVDLETMLEAESAAMLECAMSQDALEGVKAFLEKRPAIFRGS